MQILRTTILLFALGAMPPLAQAGESAIVARQILQSGKLAAGEKAFALRLAKAPADDEVRFGLGLIRFARAIEHYGQSQYRYGLQPPKTASIPFLRFPVPVNPRPEAASYEAQREVLKSLMADFAEVDAILAPMGGGDVKIRLNLSEIKFDLRDNGQADDSGKLSSILASLRMAPPGAKDRPEPFEVAFDSADALWLRGYCHLLSGSLEFLLAYDWHVAFEHSGRLFYPKIVPPPMGGVSSAPDGGGIGHMTGFRESLEIADLVALLHDTNWPLAEPQRLQAAHAHLKQVVALSRLTWKAILAETDDDHEWIPGPKQKNGVFSDMPISQDVVDEWLAALDDFDAVLDGKLLIPYWRFDQGVNLRKVFFEPRAFDLVLWITGHAAAPYVEAGPVMSGEVWDKRQHIFGGNFPGYAVWFN